MHNLARPITGETTVYGIIGRPVHHSMSPEMHNAAFRELGLDCVYIPLPTSNVGAGVAGMKALGFKGVSVTIPYKRDVMEFIDVIDPVAQKIGAVNTLVVREKQGSGNREICGFNTDWIGANQTLEEKISLRDSRVLIIGAGGSARAIGFGLLEAGAEVIIANRTLERGRLLAEQLGCPFHGLDKLADVRADALVNATSVGMVPAIETTLVPKELLPGFKVVMDIVYAPLETRLLREAAGTGCATIDGLSMLLYQGAAQFKLWTGREAPLSVMRNVLYSRFA